MSDDGQDLARAGAEYARSVAEVAALDSEPLRSALAPEGKILLPLTVEVAGRDAGVGYLLEAKRCAGGFAARFVSPVAILHCTGARSRDENDRLKRADRARSHGRVRGLRTGVHEEGERCWLHTPGVWLAAGGR